MNNPTQISLKRAVGHGAWTTYGSVGNAFISICFAGLTIRWLGLEDAGFVAAVSSITAINAALGGGGLGPAAIRSISSARSIADLRTIRLVGGTTGVCALVFGLIGFLVLALGADLIVSWSRYAGDVRVANLFCAIMGGNFLLSQLNGQLTTYLTAYERFDIGALISLFYGLVNGILGIVFLALWPSIITVAIVIATLNVIYCVLLWYLVKRIVGFVPAPNWHSATFKKLWGFGKWVYLTNISGILMAGLDKVLLVSMFGSSSLPVYAMAKRFYEIIHSLLASQASFLFPMLSSSGASAECEILRIDDRVRWALGLVSVWIYSTLAFVGPFVLRMMVTEEFAHRSVIPLLVFCVVGVLHAQAIPTFNFAYASGHAKINAIYHISSGAGAIVSMYMLGKVLGEGAMVFGQLFIAGITLIYILYYYRVLLVDRAWSRTWQPLVLMIPIMVCSLAVAMVCNHSTGSLWGGVAIGCVFSVIFFPLVLRAETARRPGSDRIRSVCEAVKILRSKSRVLSKISPRMINVVLGRGLVAKHP